MGKPKKMFIPKAPEVEKPLEIRREDIKSRKHWTRSPAEQVVPNRKKDFNEKKFSNKGNLKRHLESEFDDSEET